MQGGPPSRVRFNRVRVRVWVQVRARARARARTRTHGGPEVPTRGDRPVKGSRLQGAGGPSLGHNLDPGEDLDPWMRPCVTHGRQGSTLQRGGGVALPPMEGATSPNWWGGGGWALPTNGAEGVWAPHHWGGVGGPPTPIPWGGGVGGPTPHPTQGATPTTISFARAPGSANKKPSHARGTLPPLGSPHYDPFVALPHGQAYPTSGLTLAVGVVGPQCVGPTPIAGDARDTVSPPQPRGGCFVLLGGSQLILLFMPALRLYLLLLELSARLL